MREKNKKKQIRTQYNKVSKHAIYRVISSTIFTGQIEVDSVCIGVRHQDINNKVAAYMTYI
jgi:hypothetical protein